MCWVVYIKKKDDYKISFGCYDIIPEAIKLTVLTSFQICFLYN